MRTVLAAKFAQWYTGFFAASVLLTGCSHLAYTDPNPSTPYAFPGQPTTAQVPPGAALPPMLPVPPGPQVNVPPSSMVPPPPIGDAYRGTGVLTVGETVTIAWSDLPPPGWPETKLRIGDDGRIILPFNVTVVASGKTPNQLAEEIRKEYVPRYFVRLTPSVKTEERFYFVGGEVKIPNRQVYWGDMTVLRAIDTAGGFTDFANRDRIELRRSNGEKQTINWKKALQNPRLDLAVFPGDQVIVHKRGPFKF